MLTSASGDRCVCAAGMAWKETRCEACSQGAECTKEGQLFGKLNVLKGFWSQDATHFYRCESGTICPGGFSKCGELRTGVLCSQCVAGTSAGGIDNLCSSCENSGVSIVGFIGLLIVICVALGIVYYLADKSMTETKSSIEKSVSNDSSRSRNSRMSGKIATSASLSNSGSSSDESDVSVNASSKPRPQETSLETSLEIKPSLNLQEQT